MKLEIIGWESHVTAPDDDGDRRLVGRITVECSGEGTIGLVRTTHLVTDASGVPVVYSEGFDDDLLDDGDVAQFEVFGWPARHHELAKGQLFIEGCTAERHELATTVAPGVDQVVGSGDVIRLPGDLAVIGWSVGAVIDHDGDARLTLLVVLRNEGAEWWRRVRVVMAVKGPGGQELDSSEAEVDGIAPGSTACVDISSYIKPRWLDKGARVEIVLVGSRVLARAQAEPTDLELVSD